MRKCRFNNPKKTIVATTCKASQPHQPVESLDLTNLRKSPPYTHSAAHRPSRMAAAPIPAAAMAAAAAAGGPPHAPSPAVDMRAHTGLRGACAVWIMVFHCILATDWPFDFQGSSLMPLFMLLSGFSITVTYGATRWRPNSTCSRTHHGADEPSKADGPQEEAKAFRTWAFWRNRFARVMPVYLLSVLIAAPTWPLGYGPLPYSNVLFIVNFITSIIPVSSLVCFINLNGPGWFVCTLAVFWLLFPCLLPRVQQMTDDGLIRWIARCFHLQCTILITLFWLTLPTAGFGLALVLSTMNPIGRIPVFLMGMYAGELAIRHPPAKAGAAAEGHHDQDSSSSSSYLPWPRCFLGFLPLPPPREDRAPNNQGPKDAAVVPSDVEAPREHEPAGSGSSSVQANPPPPPPACCGRLGRPPPRTQAGWSRMATMQSAGLLLVTLLVSTGQVAMTVASGKNTATLFGFIYLQALVPMAQLNVLVALTRDGGRSWAACALHTPLAQWLGRLSMNIYLLHYPLIGYLAFLLRGATPNHYTCGPDDAGCLRQYEHNKVIPLWGIAVVAGATLLLAELVYRVVEAPARRCLRKEG